ncbi:MAG: ATP-dependent Clp protease adapter ClpS [Acidimicrobiales bacterium]
MTQLANHTISASADEETSTLVAEDTDTLTDEDLPWQVIVWNDPINLMTYVTYVLQKLFAFSNEKATSLMLDVHEKGRAIVASGTRSEAERDVHRLHAHGLWATMEHQSE